MTKLRLPDSAVLANLRHARSVRDPHEREVWLHLAVPDVDPDEANELLFAAECAHAARRGYVSERRLHDLLELQREAERELAEQAQEPVDNRLFSVDNPVDNPVDYSAGLWKNYGLA